MERKTLRTALLVLTLCLMVQSMGSVIAPGAPWVVSSTLSDGAKGLPTARVNIVLTFNAPMEWHTVYDAFGLTPNTGYTLSYGNYNLSISITNLTSGTKYTIVIATSASDHNGNYLATPYTLSFTTQGSPPQPPDDTFSSTNVVLILLLVSVIVVVIASAFAIRKKKEEVPIPLRTEPVMRPSPAPSPTVRRESIAASRPQPPPPPPRSLRERPPERSVRTLSPAPAVASMTSRETARPRSLRCPVCNRLVRKGDRVSCSKCNSVFHQACAEKMGKCPVCNR